MYETILSKIKDLGFNDEKATELFANISEEIINLMLQELAEKSTDEELETLRQRILNAKSTEHYYSILKEISKTVFGDNSEEKLNTLLIEYIDELKVIIEQSRDLAIKYKQGDPEIVAMVNKANKINSKKKV